MTDNEIKIKKEKGLFFRWDEKFRPGHRCKRQELNIIVEDLSEGTDKVTEETEDKGMRKSIQK